MGLGATGERTRVTRRSLGSHNRSCDLYEIVESFPVAVKRFRDLFFCYDEAVSQVFPVHAGRLGTTVGGFVKGQTPASPLWCLNRSGAAGAVQPPASQGRTRQVLHGQGAAAGAELQRRGQRGGGQLAGPHDPTL